MKNETGYSNGYDNAPALLEGKQATAEKVTKAEFIRFATSEGLHFCGTIGSKPLAEVLHCIDVALGGGLATRDELDVPTDKVTAKGLNLTRHKSDGTTSGRDLSGKYESVWMYRGF